MLRRRLRRWRWLAWGAYGAGLLGGLVWAFVGRLRDLPWLAAGAVVLLGAGGFWLWRRSFAEVRVLSAGLDGELVTARLLEPLLDDGYRVIHGLALSDGRRRTEIDHLVLGPSGIFVVETKRWAGVVSGELGAATWLHNGQAVPNPARQAARAAGLVRRWLESRGALLEPPLLAQYLWVQPVVCFVAPGVRLALRGNHVSPVLLGHELIPYIRGARAAVRLRQDECFRLASALVRTS